MHTKRHLTLASVLTLAIVCSAGIAADEPTFIQQMNAHWQARECFHSLFPNEFPAHILLNFLKPGN